jgi:hypothetical protein
MSAKILRIPIKQEGERSVRVPIKQQENAMHSKPTVDQVLAELPWNWDELIKNLNPENPNHAFYLRAYKARRAFGLWDAYDPAANAIIALVEAQNDIAMATEAVSVQEIADAPDMKEALTARAEAAVDLMRALLVETELTWTPQGWGARTERARQ